ncbi:MAG: hypothetical protein Q9160_005118 [Pyrenula sp. 1 TL-2023]
MEPREALRNIAYASFDKTIDSSTPHSPFGGGSSSIKDKAAKSSQLSASRKHGKSRQRGGFILYADEDLDRDESNQTEKPTQTQDDRSTNEISQAELEDMDRFFSIPPDDPTLDSIVSFTESPTVFNEIVRKRVTNNDLEISGEKRVPPTKIPRIKKYLTTAAHRSDGVDIPHVHSADKRGAALHTPFKNFPKSLDHDGDTLAAKYDDLCNNPYAQALFKDPLKTVRHAKPLRDKPSLLTVPSPKGLSSSPVSSTRTSARETPATSPSNSLFIPESRPSPQIKPTTTLLSAHDISLLQDRHTNLLRKHTLYKSALQRAGIALDTPNRSKISEIVQQKRNLVSDLRFFGRKSLGAATYLLEEEDKQWEKALLQQMMIKKKDWLAEQARQVERLLKEVGGVEVKEKVGVRSGRKNCMVVDKDRKVDVSDIIQILSETETSASTAVTNEQVDENRD